MHPNPYAYHGDDLEAAITAQAQAHGGQPPEAKPAQALGLTMSQAKRIYARPMQEVRRAFIYGAPPAVAPIGRRDTWDVWFTTKDAADHLFGSASPSAVQSFADRAKVATQTHAVERAATRFEELMAKMQRQDRAA